MDIFAHGLWTGAAYKLANKKTAKPLNVKLAIFFGVLPDLFAFAIPFVWFVFNFIVGSINFSNLPRPENMEPAPHDTLPIINLTHLLYSFSHSLIIFLIIFSLAYLILRRPAWEMFGWLGHILIDIPTHNYKFYPTPFLWPISKIEVNGFSWASPWFLAINYFLIIAFYFILYKISRK